jgi:VPDSG-CTERM motif
VINAISIGMSALPKKLLPLILFGIAVTASLFSVRPAQAYTVTLEQVGSNVVATGSGAIDLTGLSLVAPNFGNVSAGIAPSDGAINVADGFVSAYRGYSGPSSFGTGGVTLTFASSGDAVGINGSFLFVPNGYVSGTALSDTSTYNGATFSSLGVTPGTYVWSWGTGLENQNFTLVIGAAGVPDGGTTVSLLGCALLGLAALRRKLSC